MKKALKLRNITLNEKPLKLYVIGLEQWFSNLLLDRQSIATI